MGDELAVESTTNPDGSATLTVAGEIDLASAPRFRQALDDAANTHSAIEIDLRDVTYFDSAGVDALFTYATKHRIKLTIGDNRTLAAVIKVSGLDQVVTLRNGS
jgi:anti-sigma B factor antagonist